MRGARDEAAESFAARVLRRLRWAVRDLRPGRWVTRDVHGIAMAMPWSHRLPDYAAADPAYAANLADLAEGLASGGRLQFLDVGANIGDSILLVLDRVDAEVLAVEPDDVFLPFLHHNVKNDVRVVIEPSLLTGETAPTGSILRVGGTATFVPDDNPVDLPWLSVEELRSRYSQFDQLRLVKSDTDGYDVALIPAIARAWSDTCPVLFFEYDDRASVAAGYDPLTVWDALGELGYESGAIWDNGGHPLAFADIAELRRRAAEVRPSSPGIFWDVALAHRDDATALHVLQRLIGVGAVSAFEDDLDVVSRKQACQER